MHHEDLPAGEVEVVAGGEIGIVVARDQREARDALRAEREQFRPATLGMSGMRRGARVDRVAVEHEVLHPLQQRIQFLQPAEPAGVVAVMEVGKDAGQPRGHPATLAGGRGASTGKAGGRGGLRAG